MINRNAAHDRSSGSFWSTKLGHAAIASIGAMVMMVALTSQLQPGAASAAPLAHPASGTSIMIEIA